MTNYLVNGHRCIDVAYAIICHSNKVTFEQGCARLMSWEPNLTRLRLSRVRVVGRENQGYESSQESNHADRHLSQS